MDYDGFNPRRVTVNKLAQHPARLEPRRPLARLRLVSPAATPDIFLASIFEGKSANLTSGAGQAFAPSFSPDGKRIAYASNRRRQHGDLGRERRRQRRAQAHLQPRPRHRALLEPDRARRSPSPPTAAARRRST